MYYLLEIKELLRLLFLVLFLGSSNICSLMLFLLTSLSSVILGNPLFVFVRVRDNRGDLLFSYKCCIGCGLFARPLKPFTPYCFVCQSKQNTESFNCAVKGRAKRKKRILSKKWLYLKMLSYQKMYQYFLINTD